MPEPLPNEFSFSPSKDLTGKGKIKRWFMLEKGTNFDAIKIQVNEKGSSLSYEFNYPFSSEQVKGLYSIPSGGFSISF